MKEMPTLLSKCGVLAVVVVRVTFSGLAVGRLIPSRRCLSKPTGVLMRSSNIVSSSNPARPIYQTCILTEVYLISSSDPF